MNTHARCLATLFALIVAQGDAGAAGAETPAQEQTVTLGLQDRVSLPDSKLQVHFVGYRDDRCPSDVRCVWAGEAHAFFWVVGAGLKPQVVSLPWAGGQPERASQRVGPFQLRLQSLEPRPRESDKVSPTEYKAVLQIGR